MNVKKLLEAAVRCCAAGAATAFAAATDVPSVQSVNYSQPSSGSRTVTVTYTLDDAPAIVTMEVLTNGVSVGADKAVSFEGDVNKVVQPGAHTFKWFAQRDWPEQDIREDVVQIRLKAWALSEPPPYMVADLETPQNVTYYASADALPDGGLTNRLYKTSRLVMRRIYAAGVRWNMGTHKYEPGYISRTQDAIHSVQLTNDYYIGVFQLTQGQWYRIAGVYPTWADVTTAGERDVYPLQYITFAEMREAAPNVSSTTVAGNSAYRYPEAPSPDSFLGRLSSLTGIAFDLPGECEWEYACRAGNYGAKWGDGSVATLPGGGNNSTDPNLGALATYWTNPALCTPVGSHNPNSWGLYDMHGNLWEMCLDIYTADITGLDGAINTTVNSDSTHATSGAILHSERGGARHSRAYQCQSSYRDKDPESSRTAGIGFRLVSRIAQ